MKNYTLFCLLALSLQQLHAQIQGPLTGATYTNIAIPGSNQSWNNPGNASVSDDVYSNFNSITGGLGNYTDYLAATNFGFSIPSGNSITGISVEIERADPNFRTADYRVRIIKGGVVGTTDRSIGSSFPSSDSYQSYGNAGDLWGETWTDADINASGFGVAIAAQRSVTGGTTAGRIDHIRIIVFYNFMFLPVRLLNFSTLRKDHVVEISWTTTDEKNISHYELQRSTTGDNFRNSKTVRSLNLTQQVTYAVQDDLDGNETVFYRLKTIEFSGKDYYSKIISVKPGIKANLSLYPSEWKNGTPLHFSNPENKNMTIYFFNASGQLAGKVNASSSEITTSAISNVKGILSYKIMNEKAELIGTGRIKAY